MDKLHQRLAAKYLTQLKNRDVPNKRVFVIFSGVPGSGKTTLAQKIAHDFTAQYIRHDDIRAIARADGIDMATITVSKISRLVIDEIFEHDANKFVVIDASLDRTWPNFFEHVTLYKAQSIVIRLNVPREIIEARIKDRPDGDFGKITNLNMYYAQFENCRQHVEVDIELMADYDYADVRREIAARIK